MSLSSAGEAIFGDLLGEIQMKPIWEIYRGYFYAISVAAVFLMSDIITPAPTVECLPRVEEPNVTIAACVYLKEGNSWVNAYCADQRPLWLSYIDIIAGSFAAVVFLLSNWWLQNPPNICCFRTFAKIDFMIYKELDMTLEDLEAKILRIDQVEDQKILSKLTNALDMLRKIDNASWLAYRYLIRSGILIVLCVGFWAATVSCIICLCMHDEYFDCSINEQTHVVISEECRKVFVCTHRIAKKMIPLLSIFGICLFLQAIAVSIGFRVTAKAITREDKMFPKSWGTYSELVIYTRFMKLFWKNSSPYSSDRLWGSMSVVCHEDALFHFIKPPPTSTDQHHRPTPAPEQNEFVRLISDFSCHTFVSQTVIRLQKLQKCSSEYSSTYPWLLKGFDHFRKKGEHTVLSKFLYKFILRVVRAKQYELLADLLSILWVSECEEFGKIEGLLGFDFNQVDDKRKSILQYIFNTTNDEAPRKRAALHFLYNMSFVSQDETQCCPQKIKDVYTYGDLLSKLDGGKFAFENLAWLQKESFEQKGHQILLKGFQQAREKQRHIVLSDIPDELISQIVRAKHYGLLVGLLSILWVSEDKQFGKIEGLLGFDFYQVDDKGKSILQNALLRENNEFPLFRVALHFLRNVNFNNDLKHASEVANAVTDGKLSPVGKLQKDVLLSVINAATEPKADPWETVEKNCREINAKISIPPVTE